MQALREDYSASPSKIAETARRWNTSVTADDVLIGQQVIARMVSVDQWFHEVLIAGSLLSATEDELFSSLLTRAAQLSESRKVVDEAHVRRTIRIWVRFCILGGMCLPKTVEHKRVWELTSAAIEQVINDILFGELRRNLIPGYQDRKRMRQAVEANIHISPQVLSEIFRVSLEDAQDVISDVLRIFEQPVWFLEFLREKVANRLRVRQISELLKAENKRRPVETKGTSVDVVPAWIQLVVNDSSNMNWFQDGDVIRIKSEAIQHYFDSRRASRSS
jgi:hypothetical protein